MALSSAVFIRELTHILIKNGALTGAKEQQLDAAFQKSEHERYEMFLLDEGLVEPEVLLKALSLCYKVPAFDVADYFFERYLLHFFPKDFLLRHTIIPVELDEDILVVAASNPADPELAAAINEYVSHDIQFCVGIYQDICDAVEEFYDPSLTEGTDEDETDEGVEEYEFEIQMEGDEEVDEDISEI
jgi:type IV pilus assembly protein PilB